MAALPRSIDHKFLCELNPCLGQRIRFARLFGYRKVIINRKNFDRAYQAGLNIHWFMGHILPVNQYCTFRRRCMDIRDLGIYRSWYPEEVRRRNKVAEKLIADTVYHYLCRAAGIKVGRLPRITNKYFDKLVDKVK